MKICFMCDLHLPVFEDALGYDVLRWAIDDIKKKTPDAVICAGDITCDGSREVFFDFIARMKAIGIPFFYIPGNSDLRDIATRDELYSCGSESKNTLGNITVYAINDSDGRVDEDALCALRDAGAGDIVFVHHPIRMLDEASRERMSIWRQEHPDTLLFYGHMHESRRGGNDISLQALDPDKAIGECPCLTYYDTERDALRPAYFFSTVPTDLYGYLGISCYSVEEHISMATSRGLKYIELRPSCLGANIARLQELIRHWREAGGVGLSIHLPDIGYADGRVVTDPRLDEYFSLAEAIGADRFTQHVPLISVKDARSDPDALRDIAAALAERLNRLEGEITVGVENMHMTAKDSPDESRRFGYIPEECLEFMHLLGGMCRHRVGINFDIGHARNNAPFSQKYQTSAWLTLVGKHIVGYHIHQVCCLGGGKFENHTAITDIYGKLISYASTFRLWSEDRINKAPFVLEMRPEGAYEATLDTFDRFKHRSVFDIHSHTYFSSCGRDGHRALADVAVANGLSLLGISDHDYGIGDRMDDYLDKISDLAEEYKGRLRIIPGIEIATVRDHFDPRVGEKAKRCRYCLIEHLTHSDSAVADDLFEFASGLETMCGIAHTDLFEYCDMYGFDYEEFFTEMARRGIFWEMNVSFDSIHGYREHSYVAEFLGNEERIALIKRCGVYLSIGFDSHRCEDYDGYKVHAVYDLLKKHGIRTVDELL
ncbi:MAG: metallophosphoesterase family protein [Clostridia bacterium]|nr:metallophosphoesterase family protein [Clostridia bacterium]